MSKKDYTGKTAVITGASSGIGKVMLTELLRLGFTVACVSRRRPSAEGNFVFYECDLSDGKMTAEVADKIAADFDKIDLLINNAGLGLSGATELLPLKDIKYLFEVDYFSPLTLVQKLLPKMQRGSRIVNISSACALFALPYRNVYCSAKAALNMFSYGLKMELHKSGIRVVTICPGDVKTEFTQNRIKHVDTNERYGGGVQESQNKIDSRQDKRMNVNKAGKKITAIAVKSKRALHIVGAKYKALYFFSKICSADFMLKITGKMFKAY